MRKDNELGFRHIALEMVSNVGYDARTVEKYRLKYDQRPPNVEAT